MSNDFFTDTELQRQVIDQALQQYLDALDEAAPPTLVTAMKYTVMLPGKRIRPLLVLMACGACGGELEKAIPAACSVEMIHAFSLIHDDLPAMDDDDLRRGKPTNHKVFGEAQAILAGDALLAFAFEILARDSEPPVVAAECCALLATACGPSGMAGGQSDDIAGLGDDAREEDLELLHRQKTGALIEASLRMGAVIAGADEKQQEALAEYGWRIGLAFQIIDDVLDEEGSTEDLGKTSGKDAEQAKVTYVSLLGIEGSKKKAEGLIEEAKREIEILGEDAAALRELAAFVLERTS